MLGNVGHIGEVYSWSGMLPNIDKLRQTTVSVVQTHKGAIPTMSEPPLSINCLLLGSDSSGVFEVEILKTKKVSFLKDLIKEKQSRRLNHVDASDLTIWKVSLPVDTITPKLTVDDVEAQELHSVKKIFSIFGENEVDEHVHILVQVPTGALHKRFLDLS